MVSSCPASDLYIGWKALDRIKQRMHVTMLEQHNVTSLSTADNIAILGLECNQTTSMDSTDVHVVVIRVRSRP